MDAGALSLLDPESYEGYGSDRLPCPRDEEIAALIRQIQTPEDFEAAKRSLSDDHGMVLSAFGERMASLAVRTTSLQALRDGLSAEQLALAVVEDYRDSLPVLSLLLRAAEILGADAAVEFASVAVLASTPDDASMSSNRRVLDFLGRDEDDQSLASMGYVEGHDDEGFRFERTW